MILLTMGCADRSAYYGDWIGERDMRFPPDVDPAIAGNLARVKLTIRGNGTFLIVDGGVAKEGQFTPTELRVEKVMGRRSRTSEIYSLKLDGQSLRVGRSGEPTVTLQRLAPSARNP